MSLFDKNNVEEPQLSYKELKAEQKKLEKEAEESGAKLYEEPKGLNLKADREEIKRIHRERKALRPQLKKQGIKRYGEFDLFAKEVGLVYPERTVVETCTKVRAKISTTIATILASITIWKALLAVLLVLGLILYTAYVTEEKGHFTVNVTADMLEQGFLISETPDFKEDKTRLYALEITNSNATSIAMINENVPLIDGSHNGPGYMAYTFYLKNNGTETTDYAYTVNILSETMNTAAATWVMFFEDERQIIYAKAQENGKEENLFGYDRAPFEKNSYDPSSQYYTRNGRVGISTVPFIDDYTALQGYVQKFEPGEVKKYTVVVWLEGDDPDCNNSILGGHVGFNVQFDRIGEDNEQFFKGLFRKEFDKSYYVERIPEADSSDAGTGRWDGLENYLRSSNVQDSETQIQK